MTFQDLYDELKDALSYFGLSWKERGKMLITPMAMSSSCRTTNDPCASPSPCTSPKVDPLRRFRLWGRRKREPLSHPTEICRRVLAAFRSHDFDLPGPDSAWRVRRLYSGCHQKSAGAWSWALDYVPDGNSTSYGFQLGGYWAASLCVQKGHTVSYSEPTRTYSLEPSNEAQDAEIKRKYG